MRTYFVFNINKYFTYVYKDNPYKIYKMLEDIYHTKEYDILLAYRLYEQIAKPFNKIRLSEYIKSNYENKYDYTNKDVIHIISNNYEYSKLVIANANLKIKTNINYSIFFDIIRNYNNNIFICDFINKDYFWLDKVTKNDRQIINNLVK